MLRDVIVFGMFFFFFCLESLFPACKPEKKKVGSVPFYNFSPGRR